MNFIKKNLLQIALLQATIATLGSLIFSEVLKFPPCIFCWYQRIFMYPLVIILAVGIWKKDKNLPYFVLPLSIIGLFISVYHNLLYYKIIPESATPCTLGISCTTKFIEWFGFVTIPLLSLGAFAAITLIVLFYKKLNRL
ncbi:MAG: disulfide bond formation protein DsbB [uncultured bacterium]|nr:MAG: disulfide bond formation protein DsbB [uncultured bacterium]